jgi:sec-independent protein translocase protein TatC
MTMLALGAMFEVPILILALGRAGLLRSTTLRRHRRAAFLGLAVLGGLLPGTDPVTTLQETLPLFAFYEGTIVVLGWNERRIPRSS